METGIGCGSWGVGLERSGSLGSSMREEGKEVDETGSG